MSQSVTGNLQELYDSIYYSSAEDFRKNADQIIEFFLSEIPTAVPNIGTSYQLEESERTALSDLSHKTERLSVMITGIEQYTTIVHENLGSIQKISEGLKDTIKTATLNLNKAIA